MLHYKGIQYDIRYKKHDHLKGNIISKVPPEETVNMVVLASKRKKSISISITNLNLHALGNIYIFVLLHVYESFFT